MEVRFYSAFIVSVVGQNTWVDGEVFFRASVNSGAALYAVSVIDRVGNFLLIVNTKFLRRKSDIALLWMITLDGWFGSD